MERGKKFAVASFGLIFVAGFVAGLALGPLLMESAEGRGLRHRPPHHRPRMKGFYKQLHLDEKQTQRLSAIMEGTRERYRELRKEIAPRFKAIRTEMRGRIREILRPDQKKIFDQMVAKCDKEAQQWRKKMEERRRARSTGKAPSPFSSASAKGKE